MRRISHQHTVRYYDPSDQHAVELAPGETVIVEVPRGAGTPTGPIGITGAQPGDALVVSIHDVRILPDFPGGELSVWARPGRGFAAERMADDRAESLIRPLVVAGHSIVFNDRVTTIPLRPSVGVVATQPSGRRIPTLWPWRNGGNLDCRESLPGAALFLPVSVPGAGLVIGDIHAAIGDGEVMTSGAEAAGEIVLSTALVPGRHLRWPCLENEREIMVLCSGRTVEAAAATALKELAKLLESRLGLSSEDALVALALCAAVRVCQLVNPVVTVRAAIQKSVFPGLQI